MSRIPIDANDMTTLASIELALDAVVSDANDRHFIDLRRIDFDAPGVRALLRRLNIDGSDAVSPIGETRREAAMRLANAAPNVVQSFDGDIADAIEAFINAARIAARRIFGDDADNIGALQKFAEKVGAVDPVAMLRKADAIDEFALALLLTTNLLLRLCRLAAPIGSAFVCDARGVVGWRVDERAVYNEMAGARTMTNEGEAP